MSEVVEKIKKEIANFEEKRKVLVAELRTQFPALFKELFDKSNLIESIGWTQYTPFFNDGEECTFRVHISELYINEEHEEEIDWLDKRMYATITLERLKEHKEFNSSPLGYSHYKDKKVGEQGVFKNPNLNEFEYNIIEEFKEILESIPEDFFKDLFGDHSQVTVYKNGSIKVDEYDHE